MRGPEKRESQANALFARPTVGPEPYQFLLACKCETFRYIRLYTLVTDQYRDTTRIPS